MHKLWITYAHVSPDDFYCRKCPGAPDCGAFPRDATADLPCVIMILRRSSNVRPVFALSLSLAIAWYKAAAKTRLAGGTTLGILGVVGAPG